jgi:hypothetical protein
MDGIALPDVSATHSLEHIAVAIVRRPILLEDVHLQRIFGWVFAHEREKRKA